MTYTEAFEYITTLSVKKDESGNTTLVVDDLDKYTEAYNIVKIAINIAEWNDKLNCHAR